VVACGALAAHISSIAARRGWPVDVHPLPPLLHNRPDRIPAAVEDAVRRLRPMYGVVAIGFADCGTYGQLGALAERLGVTMLGGQHCYDVFAGVERMRSMLAEEPGTYVLSDFLVRSFRRTVVAELGLDRYPELRDDYFGHYRRMVWLAQRRTPDLEQAAGEAAATIGLPLEIVDVGDELLERGLAGLLA
jgi:Protein of unknown function (DUF1638)